MREFFHYTLQRHVNNILRSGMSSNISYFTTAQFFDQNSAGMACGVSPDNIDCVLKFLDDGRFIQDGTVPRTGRFQHGIGADQWYHSSKPKPIAKRHIWDHNWTPL